jgi:hypothetical protein
MLKHKMSSPFGNDSETDSIASAPEVGKQLITPALSQNITGSKITKSPILRTSPKLANKVG